MIRNCFLLDIAPALVSLASHVALSLCLPPWVADLLHLGHQRLQSFLDILVTECIDERIEKGAGDD